MAFASVFTSLSVCWWSSITILLLMVHIIQIFATVITLVLGVLVNTLQYHDTVNFVQDSKTEDPHQRTCTNVKGLTSETDMPGHVLIGCAR